jgi:hypothetical protein
LTIRAGLIGIGDQRAVVVEIRHVVVGVDRWEADRHVGVSLNEEIAGHAGTRSRSAETNRRLFVSVRQRRGQTRPVPEGIWTKASAAGNPARLGHHADALTCGGFGAGALLPSPGQYLLI